MRYSKKVGLSGLMIGIAGVLADVTVMQYGAFMILSAACVCRSIESKKDQGDNTP